MANNSRVPVSPENPDNLENGIQGRVSGVTRIGRLGLGAAAVVVLGMLGVILTGVFRAGASGDARAYPTPPPQVSTPDAGQLPVPMGSMAPESAVTLAPVPPAQPARVSPNDTGAVPSLNGTTADQSSQGQYNSGPGPVNVSTPHGPSLEEQARNAPILVSGNGGQRPLAVSINLGSLGGAVGSSSQEPYPGGIQKGGNPQDYVQSLRSSAVSPYEVVAGSVIPATLITSIDSERSGLLTAQVRQNVFDSKTGKFLLIPQGSRLIGSYKGDVANGQTRELVVWERLIFPDTSSIDLLSMSGADAAGHSGLAGSVDTHFGQIFSTALLTSAISTAFALTQRTATNFYEYPTVGQTVTQQVGTNLSQLGQQATAKNLSIPPTLHIPLGYPFLVMVNRDMVLPGNYQGDK